MMLNVLPSFCIETLCCALGLVIYAKYFECDPFSAGVILDGLCILFVKVKYTTYKYIFFNY